MSRIAIFGAGGRAGRAAVTAAVGRGHQVTAVTRDPGKHADLAADGVRLVAGDVTDATSIAEVAAGHDAAISSVHDVAVAPDLFFLSASRALLEGLPEAGVKRLVVVGLASVLPTESGVALMDTADYPQEYRSFYLGHAAGADLLRTATGDLDWVILSPAGDFDYSAAPTGRYRTAPALAGSRVTHADLAIALIDEIDSPTHHRRHLGIESTGR